MRFANQTAVITGAARGIGFGIAQRLASDGAKVALCDVNGDGAKAAAQALRANGADAIGLQVDVSDEASVQDCMRAVSNHLGKVQILVNAAGIWSELAFDAISFKEWKRIQSINVDGTFLFAQAAFRIMKDEHYGRIINIASTSFLVSQSSYASYNTSKGAVIALTRSAASEGGPHGITVNAVAPGLIVTEGARITHGDNLFDATVEMQPIRRRGIPADIAEAVAFLAAPDAGFTTGQTIYVNGGLRYG